MRCPVPERRFRDMSLTEDEAAAHVFEHWQHGDNAGIVRLARAQARARRLLPLWRAEAIRRNRLWFALIGLGLDIESDSLSDMTSREMLERIRRSRAFFTSDVSAKVNLVLSELCR